MTDGSEKQVEFERRYNTTLEGIVNTVQWLAIALILAFVFRAFIVEPFRIPTGSMAETLRGVHYHLRCTRCGYSLDLGGDRGGDPKPACASCGYLVDTKDVPMMLNGDRIFVLKSIYQFQKPQRWDVVVFKYPVDPDTNYIKRLIGRPGETVEFVDGDVYIDGKIARKPSKVQDEFWMCVFDNDYQGAGRLMKVAELPKDLNAIWVQPFVNKDASSWNLFADGPTVFSLDSEAGQTHTIFYDTGKGNDFQATYMYNSQRLIPKPICSDLMVEFYVAVGSEAGKVGAMLKKYGTSYRGWVDFDGQMVLEKSDGQETVELDRKQIDSVKVGDGKKLRFTNVDHQLTLEYGNEKLTYDLGAGVDAVGGRVEGQEPAVEVFGSGKMRLLHVGIYRDMYYMGQRGIRAREGKPFELKEDEYFVCGDNSPDSYDSRLWVTLGKGNNGQTFREGIVPGDYMIGKAFFLYWGDAYKPSEKLLPIIPNLSNIRFIHGGKGGSL